MKRVARHFVEDRHEGARAVECRMIYGLTRSTKADYAATLAEGLRYFRDQLQVPTRRRGEAWLPEGCRQGRFVRCRRRSSSTCSRGRRYRGRRRRRMGSELRVWMVRTVICLVNFRRSQVFLLTIDDSGG